MLPILLLRPWNTLRHLLRFGTTLPTPFLYTSYAHFTGNPLEARCCSCFRQDLSLAKCLQANCTSWMLGANSAIPSPELPCVVRLSDTLFAPAPCERADTLQPRGVAVCVHGHAFPCVVLARKLAPTFSCFRHTWRFRGSGAPLTQGWACNFRTADRFEKTPSLSLTISKVLFRFSYSD